MVITFFAGILCGSQENALLYEPIQQVSLTTIPALKYSDLFIDMALEKEAGEDSDATEDTDHEKSPATD